MRELIIKNMAGVFGSWKAEDVAKDVIGRIDEAKIAEGQDLEDAIKDALDLEMIYDDDKWAIVANYSDPNDPMGYGEAEELFLNDLLQILEVAED